MMRMRYFSAVSSLLFAYIMAISVTAAAEEQKPSDEKAKSFVDDIASVVLTAAWPTATYKSYSFEAIRPAGDNRYDIVFRIDAVSIWDNDIWLEAIVTIDDGFNIKNCRWGDRKWGTVKPGTVAMFLIEMLNDSKNKKHDY